MNYRNGKELLPVELLLQLQEYVEGGLIYIPRRNGQRAGWGAVNGTKLKLKIRNQEIGHLYNNGVSIRELSLKFNLSEDGIRKILQKLNGSWFNEIKRY